MSDAVPPSALQWTWDSTRGKYYIVINNAYHYQDGTTIELTPPGQAAEANNETKIAEASEKGGKQAVPDLEPKEEEEEEEEEEGEEKPPAYENISASVWCTQHQSWYEGFTNFRAHLDDTIHKTCGVHECNVNGKPFPSAGDCSIHMVQAHFCTVHDKFVANWTEHLKEATHYKCGVRGCKSTWSRKRGYKYVAEDYRRHFKKYHLSPDGYVAGHFMGPGESRAENWERSKRLRQENFEYYQSSW